MNHPNTCNCYECNYTHNIWSNQPQQRNWNQNEWDRQSYPESPPPPPPMQRRKSFSNQSVGGQSNRGSGNAPRRRNSVVYVDTNRIRNEIQESIERTIEERVSRRVQEEVEERVSRRMQQEVEHEVSQRVNEQVQNTLTPFVQGFQPFFQAFNAMMPQYQIQMPESYIQDAYGNHVYIPSQMVTVYGFQANYLQNGMMMGTGNEMNRS